jgi:hypothetical protein
MNNQLPDLANLYNDAVQFIFKWIYRFYRLGKISKPKTYENHRVKFSLPEAFY